MLSIKFVPKKAPMLCITFSPKITRNISCGVKKKKKKEKKNTLLVYHVLNILTSSTLVYSIHTAQDALAKVAQICATEEFLQKLQRYHVKR